MSRPATAPGIGTRDRPRRRARLERARPRAPWDAIPPRSVDDPKARRRLHAWLAQGYRLAAGRPCLARLAGRRCTATAAHLEWHRVWNDRGYLAHAQLWTRAGRVAALTCQPYSRRIPWRASLPERAALQADAARWGLHVRVAPRASWWAPGETTLVIITRADEGRAP